MNRSLSSLLGVLGDFGVLGDLIGAGFESSSNLSFLESFPISVVSKDPASCSARYEGVPGCGERKKGPGDLNVASSKLGKV